MSRLEDAKLLLRIPEIWQRLGLPGAPSKSCKSPFREDGSPSFSIFSDGLRWKDHATGESGDAIDFISKAMSIRNSDACVELLGMAGVSQFSGSPRVALSVATNRSTSNPLPRLKLPPLNSGSALEHAGLSHVRKFPASVGVALASKRQLLGFCSIRDAGCEQSAWVITDARRANAQARRLDGCPWQGLPGEPKARTWKGSCASWPIGAADCVNRPYAMLCEGGPDMLAALTLVAAYAQNPDEIAVLAITGAGQRIHPEALVILSGKQVRIMPHLDQAGIAAALRWDADLTAAGATVDWSDLSPYLPSGGKDLNDAVAHDAEGLAALINFHEAPMTNSSLSSSILSTPASKGEFAKKLGVHSPESPRPAAEIAETVEFPPLGDVDDSAGSANSAGAHLNNPPYPQDSVIEDWVQSMRGYTEAPDSFIIGGLLPVCAALLGRRCFIRFDGKKYPNLFSMVVGRAGMRKSTTLKPAYNLASMLLPSGSLYSGSASEEALFKQYQVQPDRLFFEDEGNTVLRNWASSAPGQMVSKRMLKLYDCAAWEQAYLRQETEDSDACIRIDETSTSLVLGATYNCCRFNGLDNRDGMQRRVNYYFAEHEARDLDWPAPPANWKRLAMQFEPIRQLSGEFKDLRELPETFRVWRELQEEVRALKKECTGVSLDHEARLSTLSEIPAKTLKFAMIFEACRWAKNEAGTPFAIRPETLKVAFSHAKLGVEAFNVIQSIGERAELRSEAESILAAIRMEFRARLDGNAIVLSKSELTHRFAGNSGRKGARTPEHLYEKVLPDLLRRGLAKDLGKNGNLQRFAFRPES